MPHIHAHVHVYTCTYSLNSDDHSISWHSQSPGCQHLDLIHSLCGCYNLHLLVLSLGDNQTCLGLQIEVILTSNVCFPLQYMLRSCHGRLYIAICNCQHFVIELIGCNSILLG